MINKLKSFLARFRNYPLWLSDLIFALVVVLLTLCFVTSCGQTVKVTVRDTPSGVSISTSQNKADSSNTNIEVNPTINLPNHGK